jgi:hypothetical protein
MQIVCAQWTFLYVVGWTGEGTYTRAPCQKNEVSVKIKQRPTKMGSRTIYRTLSPKTTPFQTGTDRRPYLLKVPRKRRISHTYPMWLWGHSLFKISSPGAVFYGTKWLLWRPPKQSPTFHSKCRIDKRLFKRGSTIDHWRSQCKGRIFVVHPYAFIHVVGLVIILHSTSVGVLIYSWRRSCNLERTVLLHWIVVFLICPCGIVFKFWPP